MTNTIAAVLALLIMAFFAFDIIQNDGRSTIFLSRQFLDMIQAIAFWR